MRVFVQKEVLVRTTSKKGGKREVICINNIFYFPFKVRSKYKLKETERFYMTGHRILH